jgi:hypothetical protein
MVKHKSLNKRNVSEYFEKSKLLFDLIFALFSLKSLIFLFIFGCEGWTNKISFLYIVYSFFVPGYAFNQIFLPKEFYYRDMSRLTIGLFIDILASIAVISIVSLIMAIIGCFNVKVLLCIMFSLSLFLIIVRLVFRDNFIGKGKGLIGNAKELIYFFVIAAIAFLTLFHSYEMISGGHDQGVYVVTGVNIAKTGSITIHSEFIENMTDDLKQLFYMPKEPENGSVGAQFPGFYIADIEKGTIYPQFLPLYPVWIALFYSFFGLRGAFLVNPIFGILSVLCVFLLCRMIFDYRVGTVAALFLALSYVQIWYSNYTTSEIMAQFFIFSGLLMLALFSQIGKAYMGIISAIFFGCSFFTRVDAMLIILALMVFIVYNFRRKGPLRIAVFTIVLVFFISFSIIYGLTNARPYYLGTLKYFVGITGTFRLPIGTLKLEIHSILNNLYILSGYLSIPVLIMVFLGLIVALVKKKQCIELWTLIIIFLTFTIVYTNNPMLNVEGGHPWWVRRFVPVTIPVSYILVAYLIICFMDVARDIKNTNGKFLLVSLLVALTAIMLFNFQQSKVLMNHEEGKGIINGYEELSSYFEGDDIVFTYEYFITSPLNYIFDKNVIFIVPFNEFNFYSKPSKELIERYLLNLIGVKDRLGVRDIYLVAGDTNPIKAISDHVEEIGQVDFEFPRLVWSQTQIPPQEIDHPLWRFKIFKLKTDF